MPKDFGGVMREFKSGKLHSGSKSGPKVTNPQQAKAIAASEDRQFKSNSKQRKHLTQGYRNK